MKHTARQLLKKWERMYEYPQADHPTFEQYKEGFNECYEALYDLYAGIPNPGGVPQAIEALRLAAEPEGPFRLEPLEFAKSCLAAVSEAARAALAAIEEQDDDWPTVRD